MSIKAKLDQNLVFVWDELMSDRARMLAKRAAVFVLLGSALLIAVPYAVGFYIDGLTTQILDALLVGGILFLSFEILGVILGWFRQQVRERFFQEEFWYLPQAITRKYLVRPLSYVTERDSEIDGGGVESLRDKVWNVIGIYIFQIVPDYGSMAFGVLACTYADWRIGGVVVLYIVLEFWLSGKDNAYIQREMRPVIDQFKRWERRMHERWHSVDHVKNQGVETKILGQIHHEVQEALKGDDAVWRVYFAKAIVRHRLRGLASAVLIYGGVGYLALGDVLSLASGILVFFSFERIRTVLGEINEQQREVQFNLASIAKYRRVLTQPVPFTYDQGDDFTESSISVTFDRVCHSMTDGGTKKPILRDVSLTVDAGERVGVVGPSGAGKSQLMSLLVRATDPESGRVLLSGRDLRELRTESLLRYYGVIMQKSEPFEDTVLGNLAFGVSHLDLPIDLDELPEDRRVGVEAHARESLAKAGLNAEYFPEGVMTNIGYKGMKLSGGQQQRLQIAAAHFKLGMTNDRPRLILADEPTSSLDSLSETTVMEHLQDALPEGTTMFMVAHRLSTVAHMDRIVFVRPLESCAADVSQVTTHASLAELYCTEPIFKEMADAQGFRP